ncbi:MAG: non-canonical purine NTP pyrophosphatase, RdgB/HAM1 family [Deltaproteobacteria bacterium GWC2_56_8]|nr:MAG: non-canonical purine NTP pyrophosphatase, RdgB/HAM1 family [Deltaproteobacteria bacterium GWB2_55_19]OGP32928.1 MAG: non-canonical purine NTP pyrophosphatase, RdgB/HAM1 family [Deltaproteobacteria bacterium GWC2_56_8]
MKLVIATKNRSKARELGELLKGLAIVVLSLSDFPAITLPPEDATTFRENALKKARSVFEATGLPSLADDSGLVVDALDGAPGIYSARYAGESATDEDNCRKLLAELADVAPEKRTARFVCALAYKDERGEEVFDGELRGRIAASARGENGFGYDPVFEIEGLWRTSAELSGDEKNAISHRAKALKRFQTWLAGRQLG